MTKKDIRSAIPVVLTSLKDKRIGLPYFLSGMIKEEKREHLVALINDLTSMNFVWDESLDEESQKKKIEQWLQWWEKEGKNQELNLEAIKKRYSFKE